MKRLHFSGLRGLWLSAMLLCLISSALTGQKVSGVIKALTDDQPVVGATVAIKGTTIGTVVD